MDYPNSLIRAGDQRRDVVMAVQARLAELGIANLSVDGDFGPDTEAAVNLFQARGVDEHGRPLSVDGVIGPSTWWALFDGDTPELVTDAATPLLTRALQVAASQVGVRERPLGSNGGPEVDKYLASIGLDPGYAWCAAFLYWCFREAAGPGGGNPCPRTGGVHELWRQCGATRKRRYTPAQIAAHPEVVRPGQFFFLDTGGGYGHVGFIEAVNGVYLTTIEGNTNEGGSRNGIGVFRRTSRKISGITLGVADVTETLV